MGEAKRKRREDKVQVAWDKMCNDAINGQNSKAIIDGLIAAQGEFKERQTWFKSHQIDQLKIPDNLNVFATMEAAWQDLVDRWFHEGMPDRLQQDAKFIFYHGVQAAANLMMYCEGQDMFGAAADQVQGDCIAYEKEAEAVLAERKADEWRTGEI